PNKLLLHRSTYGDQSHVSQVVMLRLGKKEEEEVMMDWEETSR
ncbi:uncharacterized, partial [Tachysurus ichikawai]